MVGIKIIAVLGVILIAGLLGFVAGVLGIHDPDN